jgi:hypothetical protein
MPHELTGGCFCGAVRYRAAGVKRTSYCHCRMCQKASGAPVVAFLAVPVQGFTLISGTMTAYRSSEKAVRHFCGRCGTQLTFRLVDNPVEIDVNLATLDHPERLAPADHIYTASAMPWLRIEDGLPRHEEARPA